ncbi:FAD-dependent oxidoreductase [Streptomyces sp. B1866]|uniref:FAD-dependent oxidoreductase n=1 Tax=Streptomyces sp. B1866 TaxID=3075431 RepID=UPI002891F38D|nr:FAD-dependent oxidoreductase [Streptomyces sp. B1866]MDT3397668.1 FAD-dependent oxidoreductase [Streptomyces sp. B1866]
MAYAITQTCCNDASCVSVCPVNCIHPTPDDPDFGTTDLLYIDPKACIDCGACVDACPVDAIFPVDRLRGSDTVYAELNRQYYDTREGDNAWGAPHFPQAVPDGSEDLRIAVVGTGPAASYTAQALLRATGASVTMIDRLPVPGGLVRFGVAPDHTSTKRIGDSFAGLFRHPRVRVHMNVEAGKHVTAAEIAAHHHAVVYAVGAATDRALGIPGEDLPGSLPATAFVGWYNAHPGMAATAVDLSAERAVVVGNGNVALDVARILVSDPERLAATDIADHALAALRDSGVREVVLLGRRGPDQAAFTGPEFLALTHLPGVEVVVDDADPHTRAALAAARPGSTAALLRGVPARGVDLAAAPAPGKRIVFRFFTAPTQVIGDGRVEALRVAGTRPAAGAADGPVTVERTGAEETVAAGLLVRSIGYRSSPVPGLPFDAARATVPHRGGRVVDPATGEPLAGTYVVGWIKRGPSGGIGTNRTCAAETVDALLADAAAGRLPRPVGTAREFARLVRRRRPSAIGRRQVLAIDQAERRLGERAGRLRVKFATVPELLRATRRPGPR